MHCMRAKLLGADLRIKAARNNKSHPLLGNGCQTYERIFLKLDLLQASDVKLIYVLLLLATDHEVSHLEMPWMHCEMSRVLTNQTKLTTPHYTKPNQTKLNQTKPNQTKPTKLNQTKPTKQDHHLH